MNDKLHAATITRHGLDALIEGIDGAAFVVSTSGSVLFANSEGEKLAQRGALLLMRDKNRLAFVQTRADETYRRALGSVADPSQPEADTTFTVTCPKIGEATVMVLPLRAKSNAASQTSGTIALVHIRPKSVQRHLPRQLLQSHFRLTAAEAEVAAMIAAGFDAQQIAETFSVSKVTVRNQIASILAKLGVRRQAEVATLLMGLAPSLALSKRQ